MGGRVKRSTVKGEWVEESLIRDLFHRWCEQRYENRRTLERWLSRDRLHQQWMGMERLEKLPPF